MKRIKKEFKMVRKGAAIVLSLVLGVGLLWGMKGISVNAKTVVKDAKTDYKEIDKSVFDSYKVWAGKTDKEQMVRFEVIREKENIDPEAGIPIKIKATNISNQVIYLMGSSGTLKEGGCFYAEILSDGEPVMYSDCYKDNGNKLLLGGGVTDDCYQVEMAPGETIEAWHCMKLWDENPVEEGKYNMYIELHGFEDETKQDLKEFKVSVPVYVTGDTQKVVDSVVVGSGDADCNGKLELADAQLALKAALKIVKLDDNAVKSADVIEGDSVNLADAQKILKYALKIEEPRSK